MAAPLAGVRVLDLTRHYPGPYAPLLLSDLGADVVKLEDGAPGDPRRDRAGHDIGYLAVSGVLSRCGVGDLPVVPGVQIADFFSGGLQAVVAILAALIERAGSGRGRLLDVGMCEGAMQALLPRMAD